MRTNNATGDEAAYQAYIDNLDFEELPNCLVGFLAGLERALERKAVAEHEAAAAARAAESHECTFPGTVRCWYVDAQGVSRECSEEVWEEAFLCSTLGEE